METAELIPLSGIQIQDKTIALSSTRREVEALLGAPFPATKIHYITSKTKFDLTLTPMTD